MRELIYILALFTVVACSTGTDPNDKPIARVYDDILYQSDLTGIFPEGVGLEDSLQIAKNHVDKWIRNRLILIQAEQNLTENEKNVERQIEDYRTSLLIFKYEQNFINRKLDTVVSEEEIAAYYDEFSSNFILNSPLIQGMFIKVLRSTRETWRVRRWYQSVKPEDLKKLEEYCYSNSAEFDYFDEDWKYYRDISKKLPRTYLKPEQILKYRKYFETRDTTHIYFLKIGDFRLAGAVAPLPMVKDDIKSILLNKRKIKIVQELEAEIYNDALNHEYFTVFD